MTLLDPTPVTSELAEAVRGKLQNAPGPLKITEAAKGLPKPRKTKAADFQNEVRSILDEQLRLGQVFRYPSGKNEEMRYWSRDEKHLLRDRALELASTPQTLAALKAKLKKEAKGVETAFVESVIQELIGESKLFEHPAKKARGRLLLGAMPPPPPPPPLPPLAQPKHTKALNKVIAECQKLLAASQVSVEELLQAVQARLRPSAAAEPNADRGGSSTPPAVEAVQPPRAELDEIILKALAQAPVLSLTELRASLPAEYRGTTFDETVLRLADEQQVILSQDAVPEQFSEREKAEYVRDGDAVFTTIAKWS